jgi:hypothetical protein
MNNELFKQKLSVSLTKLSYLLNQIVVQQVG